MSRFRSGLALVALASAAAGTLVAGSAAASAAAKPESQTFLLANPVPVTTSTGQHLMLSVSADRFSKNTAKPDLHSKGTVTVELTNHSRTETHSWTFPIVGDSFATNAKGNGSVKTAKQLAPFGSLDLKVKSTGAGTKLACGAGNYEVVHPIAVKGTIAFDTESTGKEPWGMVTEQKVKFAPGSITGSHGPDAEEGCSGLGEQPCVASTQWSASNRAITISGATTGTGKKQTSTIEGSRFVPLSKPKNATRFDDVNLKAPALVVGKGKKPTLTIGTAGSTASGTATVKAKTHSPYTIDCKGGEETGNSWTGTYTPGHIAITLTETAFPKITLGKVNDAFFSKVKA